MPLARYFMFTGGILLALLFLADWYLPAKAEADRRAEVDRSIIRIHSQHRWPEAIIFDMGPAGAPLQTTATLAVEQAPPDASAQLPPPRPIASPIVAANVSNAAPKPATKVRAPARRVASYRSASREAWAAGW